MPVPVPSTQLPSMWFPVAPAPEMWIPFEEKRKIRNPRTVLSAPVMTSPSAVELGKPVFTPSRWMRGGPV